MDLYRLKGETEQEFSPLDLPHVFQNCVSLVEWPERLPEKLVPKERLDVSIEMIGDNGPRKVAIQSHSSRWDERLRSIRIEGYLDDLLI